MSNINTAVRVFGASAVVGLGVAGAVKLAPTNPFIALLVALGSMSVAERIIKEPNIQVVSKETAEVLDEPNEKVA